MQRWENTGRLYHVHSKLESRSITYENRTGAKGAGGTAASPLGIGRKGDPARFVQPGEVVELCDITGPGTIRHLWMTTTQDPEVMRATTIRAWWEGSEFPSIEAPLGDFFGFAHGRTPPYESVAHSVGMRNALNFWLEMPFTSRARLTLTNELDRQIPLFFQIDYTLGDAHDAQVGRLHAAFARSNPTVPGEDFVFLPRRQGAGAFLGTVIGVRPLDPRWWGEGEAKFWLDGDEEFATIVGTGAEDYVGISFCIQQTPFRYHGVNWREKEDRIDTGRVSMYRWHIADPIFWKQDIKGTIQQIGLNGSAPATAEEYKSFFYDRPDDWSACSFWYEATPSQPLPSYPSNEQRTADLPAPPEISA